MTRTMEQQEAAREDQCAVCHEPFADADGRRWTADLCGTCGVHRGRLCTSCKAAMMIMEGRWVRTDSGKIDRREWRAGAVRYLRRRCGCWAKRAVREDAAPVALPRHVRRRPQ